MPPRREQGIPQHEAERFAAQLEINQTIHEAIATLIDNQNEAMAHLPPQPQGWSLFERFDTSRPPRYAGVIDPKIMIDWINSMEKFLCYIKCCSWEEFKDRLNNRFYPNELRLQETREFLDLKQWGMSLQAYTDKFVELVPYARTILPTELDQVRYYERGFIKELCMCVTAQPATTFDAAYDRALRVWADLSTDSARGSQPLRPFKRPFVPSSPSSSQGFKKKPTYGFRQGFRPLMPRPSVMKNQKSICYNCKQPGHYNRDCPQLHLTVAAVSGSSAALKKAPRVGVAYVLTRAQAEANPEVITGMFSVCDIPALVLFDTGASLSIQAFREEIISFIIFSRVYVDHPSFW
ncbi:hypothetical protein RND81_11G077200 [Saponaria officinalis]|uniref:CCHC-type domain-containing protein n=1 Tax=Saponaria officinalis TaxID=3572 RepID=A0AAW1HKS9_SAPOF